MEVSYIETWNAFEEKIEEINEALEKTRKEDRNIYVSKPLFRGQPNATWKLETSLERYGKEDVSLQEYNRYLLRIGPSIQAFTAREWELKNKVSVTDSTFQSVTNYEFMAYARHHGFPSPLLDWSQSQYVSLFFAYHQATGKEDVSIFVYVDDVGRGKGGMVGAPQISEQGEYVAAHKRHFMQQSQYTIATKKKHNKWVYCNHHDFFDSSKEKDQAVLYKLILSGEKKIDFLRKLNKMNINAYTLYGSEESLMDMLAFRAIVEKNL